MKKNTFMALSKPDCIYYGSILLKIGTDPLLLVAACHMKYQQYLWDSKVKVKISL
jgi:hypothetical protein